MGLLPVGRMVISAPFGNYFAYPGATSTLGTFTWRRRAGPLGRAWRCLLTLRYLRRPRSWVNRLGLPNPGVRSLAGRADLGDKIVSVHGLDAAEWASLAAWLLDHPRPAAVELNLSCPNVAAVHYLTDVCPAVDALLAGGVPVIAKLAPVRWMDFARPLYARGVRAFHCCNTIPTPGGGLSGKPLKQYSLWVAEEIKANWGSSVAVIGGGGVTSQDDVDDYRRAGADHVAIGSAFLNPLRWRGLRRLIEHNTPPEA